MTTILTIATLAFNANFVAKLFAVFLTSTYISLDIIHHLNPHLSKLFPERQITPVQSKVLNAINVEKV